MLAAEVKWTSEPVGLAVLHTLERRVALLPRVVPDRQLALFAKTGFTADVQARRTPSLALYTLDDLLP